MLQSSLERRKQVLWRAPMQLHSELGYVRSASMHTTRLHLGSNPFCLLPSGPCLYIKTLYKHAGLGSVVALLGFIPIALCSVDDGAVKTLHVADKQARFGMALAFPGRATAIHLYLVFADKGVNLSEPGADVHQCGGLLCMWGRPGAVGPRPYGSCGVYGPPILAHAAASPHAAFHQNLSPST